MLENITLSQTVNLYDPGPPDVVMGDFDLLAKEKEIANVAFTGKEEGPKMPVGCYEHFVTDNDLRDLLNSTESKNTRKNTN